MKRLLVNTQLGKVSDAVLVDDAPKSVILTIDERAKLDELNELLNTVIGLEGIDVNNRVDRFFRLSARLETDLMSVDDRMNTAILAINIVSRHVDKLAVTKRVNKLCRK